MLVRELMTRSAATVRADTTISRAGELLLDSDITAAPVVDDNGHVIGIVSRRDLLAGREIDDPRAHLIPAHGDSPEPPHLVHDVMTRNVIVIAPIDDDAHAARIMLEHGLASLPVLEHGELVGMISVTDILRSHTHSDAEIARTLRERFFEYGESHPLGTVSVDDGVVTVTDTDSPLTTRIAEAVAETTEGVVGVHIEPSHPQRSVPRARSAPPTAIQP
jgi:CBS domain-containing protein